MSQPSTPSGGSAIDPLLLSIDQQQQHQLTQPQSGINLSSNETGHYLFSFKNSDGHGVPNFAINNSYTPLHSSNSSGNSTPDFSTYSFDQKSPSYPIPGQNFPHPYPLDLQQSRQSNVPQDVENHGQRPPPIRWLTNSPFLQPTRPPQTYVRRRSLSHGDADRLASTPSNPTFVRLQALRVMPTPSDETKRLSPYSKHGRSTSQGSSVRGRPLKPTGTSQFLSRSPFADGIMSTPIGTPLQMMRESTSVARSENETSLNTHCKPAHGLSITYSNPFFEHMTHPDDLARSRHIIQIGAMTAVEHSKQDPGLRHDNEGNDQERMLKKLQDVEQHLQEKTGDEEVLKACTVLRDALTRTMDTNDVVKVDNEDHDGCVLEAPSKALSPANCGLYYAASDGTDLMAMLREESTRIDDSGVDDL